VFVAHTVPGLEGHRTVPIKSILVAVHFLRHRRLRIPNSDWLLLVPRYLCTARTERILNVRDERKKKQQAYRYHTNLD
jgi:hypothetical protein